MEYLEGRTLKHWNEGKPLAVDKVPEIGIPIAEGFEAAREKGNEKPFARDSGDLVDGAPVPAKWPLLQISAT